MGSKLHDMIIEALSGSAIYYKIFELEKTANVYAENIFILQL